MKTIINLITALLGTLVFMAIIAVVVWVLWNFFWFILIGGIFIAIFANVYSELKQESNNEQENGTIQTSDRGDSVA